MAGPAGRVWKGPSSSTPSSHGTTSTRATLRVADRDKWTLCFHEVGLMGGWAGGAFHSDFPARPLPSPQPASDGRRERTTHTCLSPLPLSPRAPSPFLLAPLHPRQLGGLLRGSRMASGNSWWRRGLDGSEQSAREATALALRGAGALGYSPQSERPPGRMRPSPGERETGHSGFLSPLHAASPG